MDIFARFRVNNMVNSITNKIFALSLSHYEIQVSYKLYISEHYFHESIFPYKIGEMVLNDHLPETHEKMN